MSKTKRYALELASKLGCISACVDDNATCDICQKSLFSGKTFYDAATVQGPWGWMCQKCFNAYGVGLGTGVGQEYSSINKLKIRG